MGRRSGRRAEGEGSAGGGGEWGAPPDVRGGPSPMLAPARAGGRVHAALAHFNGRKCPEHIQLCLLRVVGALIRGSAAEGVAAADVDGLSTLGGHLGLLAHKARFDLLFRVGVHPLDQLQVLGIGEELLPCEQILVDLRTGHRARTGCGAGKRNGHKLIAWPSSHSAWWPRLQAICLPQAAPVHCYASGRGTGPAQTQWGVLHNEAQREARRQGGLRMPVTTHLHLEEE